MVPFVPCGSREIDRSLKEIIYSRGCCEIDGCLARRVRISVLTHREISENLPTCIYIYPVSVRRKPRFHKSYLPWFFASPILFNFIQGILSLYFNYLSGTETSTVLFSSQSCQSIEWIRIRGQSAESGNVLGWEPTKGPQPAQRRRGLLWFARTRSTDRLPVAHPGAVGHGRRDNRPTGLHHTPDHSDDARPCRRAPQRQRGIAGEGHHYLRQPGELH